MEKAEYIDNYLTWSILVTACCCLPLGIYAIVLSTNVNTLIAQGNIESAKDTARRALKINIIATSVGAVISAVYIMLLFTAGGAALGVQG